MYSWGINIWVALGLLISYVLIDFFCVKHVVYIQRRQAIPAANVSFLISLLGLLSTFEFIKRPLYIIPILIGVWLGSYLAVKFSSNNDGQDRTDAESSGGSLGTIQKEKYRLWGFLCRLWGRRGSSKDGGQIKKVC
jgi:hypothetical protein